MITISVNPIAFHVGSMEVRWYGILITLAVATIILWMWQQITRKRADLPKSPDPTMTIFAILSGLVASKVFHVIDRWDYYSQNLWEIFSGGGLTIYGAIIGVTLFFWIYSKVTHRQFGFFADLVAPGIILAQAIGRVGCTINGCCYGKLAPDWLPWSVVYAHPNSYAPLGVALHPTTVYEIIFALALFGVLLRLRGRLKPDGSLFLLYFTLYSAWRLGIGFLREGTPFLLGLPQAQFIAIVVLAITIPILALRTRWVKAQSDAE